MNELQLWDILKNEARKDLCRVRTDKNHEMTITATKVGNVELSFNRSTNEYCIIGGREDEHLPAYYFRGKCSETVVALANLYTVDLEKSAS